VLPILNFGFWMMNLIRGHSEPFAELDSVSFRNLTPAILFWLPQLTQASRLCISCKTFVQAWGLY